MRETQARRYNMDMGTWCPRCKTFMPARAAFCSKCGRSRSLPIGAISWKLLVIGCNLLALYLVLRYF